jgi:hypothetical protein
MAAGESFPAAVDPDGQTVSGNATDADHSTKNSVLESRIAPVVSIE